MTAIISLIINELVFVKEERLCFVSDTNNVFKYVYDILLQRVSNLCKRFYICFIGRDIFIRNKRDLWMLSCKYWVWCFYFNRSFFISGKLTRIETSLTTCDLRKICKLHFDSSMHIKHKKIYISLYYHHHFFVTVVVIIIIILYFTGMFILLILESGRCFEANLLHGLKIFVQ